ncbi:MAG TPA: beta-ketoacyl-ACP synthase III [Anaerolineales bacterium]|nr:beta-ketoacyl-ACP synthase III [Anaerolineales bacterium]
MPRYAHVTGWGMAVPELILTNADLAKMVETTDEWIVERTGIRERHLADKHESTATLAVQAAQRALERTEIRPRDLGLIIVATSSPEHIFPATASIVQDRLGARTAGAFDLSAACTGFIFAVNMAAQAIRSGALENALVIGAETLSRIVNWDDRSTCILFGDGAGAFVLQASEKPGGVLSCVMRSDGSGADLLSVPAGGSRIPTTIETVRGKLHGIHMNGREVFRFATRVMASATHEAVEQAGLHLDDIELVVPHQANLRIIEAAARGLRLPLSRFMINIERYGNTSTASIPMAVTEAVEAGRVHPGDHLVLVGFGAGLTWGALTLQCVAPERPVPTRRRRLSLLRSVVARLRSSLRRVVRWLEGLLWGAAARRRSGDDSEG